jgi:hypothetical protein
MTEQKPPAYRIVAKRGDRVVMDSAVRAENLRGIVRTLTSEMLKVEYFPLDELPDELKD